jgi:hypothetical protein
MSGEKELLALLGELPERIQNRVFRFAGRKVGNAIAQRAAALTPRHRTNVHGPRTNRHLADSFINKQKVYRASETTVNIVGGQTGTMGHNRINHLVEEGTAQRFTNSRSKYKTISRGLVTRTRKVKTASGGWRTVKVKEQSTKKQSIGSFRKGPGARLNRGRMPAFHQLAKAVAETPVEQIYENEIRAGLQRIADRAAKAG